MRISKIITDIKVIDVVGTNLTMLELHFEMNGKDESESFGICVKMKNIEYIIHALKENCSSKKEYNAVSKFKNVSIDTGCSVINRFFDHMDISMEFMDGVIYLFIEQTQTEFALTPSDKCKDMVLKYKI